MDSTTTDTPRKVGRPKKVADPDNPIQSYMLKGIPLELWLACRAKATREQTTMKDVLVLLLRAWVET